MFGKSNKLPDRKEFSLSGQQVIDDIKNVYNDEEQREKLYVCIDEKMPVLEKKFSELQKFLRATSDIEEQTENLKTLIANLDASEQKLAEELEALKQDIENTIENVT